MRRILCFGDSNTYGYSPVDGQRYGDDINWPGVLGKLLGDKFEVINEGKNGRTIAFDDPYNEGCNGLSDIGACLDQHEPLDLVIIMLGTNDLKVYFDSNPQAVASNLKKMCEVVQEKTDARLIIVSPTLLGDQIEFSPLHLEFGRTQVDYSFELAPAFEQVAKAVGAEFIDLAMVAMSSDVDCLHLMPEEHKKVAQAMRDKVMGIFREDLEREAKEEEEAAKAAELRRIQEEEAKRRAEEEARRQAEEAQRAEEEARVREEEAARLQAEQEAEREAERRAQEEAQRAEEEVARLKVEAILKAAEEEAAREEAEKESAAVPMMEEQEEDAGTLQTAEFVNPLEDVQEFGSAAEASQTVSLSAETEKEKMLSGKLYICDDALRAEMSEARKLTMVYNQTDSEQLSKRTEILTHLLKSVGESPYIEPPFRCDYGSHISVGDNFYANFDCIMLDTADIKIGDNVFFGPKVNIYTACHPIYAPVRNRQLEYSKEVTIGDDVWIGGNVTVNPGVHIGSNVVIGSGSVVTGDIPDGVVAAGNPCRIIRRISDADKQYWEEQREEYDR